jgi:hypothetical protein
MKPAEGAPVAELYNIKRGQDLVSGSRTKAAKKV